MITDEIREYNKQLIAKYPWLLPYNRFTGKVPDDYDYNGDKHPLSESDDSYNNGYIKALEYEVFEVLFD